MPQLDRTIIKERAARLREAGDTAYCRHLDALNGSQAEILFEREGMGRTPQFTPVRIEKSGLQDAGLAKVVVTGHDGNMASARLADDIPALAGAA